MRIAVALILLAAAATAGAQGDLLGQVRDGSAAAARLSAEREVRFARERDAEAARLREAQAELARARARVAAANRRWEAARRGAAEAEQRLASASRELDTMYDAARGAAVDLHDLAQGSLVTAQFPDRMAALAPLAAGATRPGAAELEQIWQALRFDIAQSGAVVRFEGGIATPDGEVRRRILRAGVFAAVADGRFLRLQGGGTRLAEMERQPSWSVRRIAAAFEGGASAAMLLDPSRGALLLAEANRPGLFGRLWHSGIGGYFIAAGLLLALALAVAQPLWLRSRLILDEQSIGVVAAMLAAFALVQLVLWRPGEPSAAEERVATVTLVNEPDEAANDQPPAPQIEPPAPPPASVAPDAPALPTLAAPVAPASSIQLPVQLASTSLSRSGFGGFARGSAAGWGRGQGFKGEMLMPLSTARPQMPDWACKQKIKGWVEAVFIVLPSGRVQDVKIVDAQPRGVYEVAAIESISNWIYAETDRAREVKQRVPMDPADCAYNWR